MLFSKKGKVNRTNPKVVLLFMCRCVNMQVCYVFAILWLNVAVLMVQKLYGFPVSLVYRYIVVIIEVVFFVQTLLRLDVLLYFHFWPIKQCQFLFLGQFSVEVYVCDSAQQQASLTHSRFILSESDEFDVCTTHLNLKEVISMSFWGEKDFTLSQIV